MMYFFFYQKDEDERDYDVVPDEDEKRYDFVPVS